MPQINQDLITSVKRKRGELNLTVLELSKQTDISRWTLDKLLNSQRTTVQNQTIERLNNWLYTFL